MVWYSHLLKNFPQFVVIHIVKGFVVVNKAEVPQIRIQDFPGGASGKERICQCRGRKRCEFNPWIWKNCWRRAWQSTTVFLPGESHGQRNLVGCSPWIANSQTRLKRLSSSSSTRLQSNAQNSPSQTSAVHEPRSSRCPSWI